MTTEQVERAFNKAVELSAAATSQLAEGCVGQGLVQSLFINLLEAERDNPKGSLLKEAA